MGNPLYNEYKDKGETQAYRIEVSPSSAVLLPSRAQQQCKQGRQGDRRWSQHSTANARQGSKAAGSIVGRRAALKPYEQQLAVCLRLTMCRLEARTQTPVQNSVTGSLEQHSNIVCRADIWGMMLGFCQAGNFLC